MKWATILILIIGLWASAPAQTLEDYTGLTAAQLSAMTDRVTVPNTSYWNTHAYLQLKLLIDRVLRMYSADSTTAYVTWSKLSAAVQDSILSNMAASSVTWSDLVAAVQDSIQHNDRISANGVLWAMLAAAVQDSIQLQDRISANAITTAKLDTLSTGWIDVRKFGATGDGTTDDTGALRAALTAGAGKTILIPPGIYLSDTLIVPANTRLFGLNESTLKLNNATSCLSFIHMSDSSSLVGITVNGNRAAQSDNINLVMIDHKKNVVIDGCNLYGGGSCGVVALRGQQIKVINNRIHDIYSVTPSTSYPDVATGILFYSSSSDATGNYRIADKNEVYDIGIVGITANPAAKNVVISNNSIHDLGYSGGTGVLAIELFNAGDKCIVTGNVIEDIVKHDVGGWIMSIAMARGTIVTNNVIVISDSIGNAVEWFATNSVFANNTIRVQSGARVSDALIRMSAASNNTLTGNSVYVWGFASCVFSLEGTGTYGWRDNHYSDNYDSLGCWNNNISHNTVMGDSSLGAFLYCQSRNYNTTVEGNTYRGRQALFITDAIDLNVLDNDFTCTDTTDGDSYANVAMGGTVHGINRVNIVGNNFVTNRNFMVINGADTVNVLNNTIHLGSDPKSSGLPFWGTTVSDRININGNVLGSGFSSLYYTNTIPSRGWYFGLNNIGTVFGVTQAGYNWAVNTGGFKTTDSLTVGAGGVWMRNFYQSGNDIGIIFYNSALSRVDTVFAKQP